MASRLQIMRANFVFVFLFVVAFALDEQAQVIPKKEWWRTAAVYQVYPLSLKDSDNDGKGDLKGITEKIPYLKETGLDAIWISPIYSSPMADFGYDISNYTGIHEWYGTMEDFDALAKKIHDSEMKLIMDFVPNHTSNKHEWFIKSENRVPGYEDYYVWKNPKGVDSKGEPIPPNNWISIFYNSAWTYSEKRKQFYLHHFLKEQPDLNFRNPKVIEEMDIVILFWLRKGVDGFRIDAVPFVFENKDFLDEPRSRLPVTDPKNPDYLDHIYTQHQPETYALIQQWRKLVDRESQKDGKERALMVEAYGEIQKVTEYFGKSDSPGAHFPFNFQLIELNTNSSAQYVKRQVNSWFDNLPQNGHSNWVIGNHDQHRIGSKIGADLIDGMNILVTLLPGISVTYYGEEIGMINNNDITFEEGVDPQGCRYPKDQFQFRSRDFERTPFQWDLSVNSVRELNVHGSPGQDFFQPRLDSMKEKSVGFWRAGTYMLIKGFNKGKKPWLPVNKNYKELNLEAQKGKSYSHYSIFTDLMKLRKTPVIQNGETLVQTVGKGTLGIVRSLGSNNFVVALINFSKTEDQINLDSFFLVGKRQLKVYTTHFESGFKKGDLIDAINVKLPGRTAVVLIKSDV